MRRSNELDRDVLKASPSARGDIEAQRDQLGVIHFELDGDLERRNEPLDIERVRFGVVGALMAIIRSGKVEQSRIGWGKWDRIAQSHGVGGEAVR